MGKRVFHFLVGNTVRTLSQDDLLRVHYFRKKKTSKLPWCQYKIEMKKSESISTDISVEA